MKTEIKEEVVLLEEVVVGTIVEIKSEPEAKQVSDVSVPASELVGVRAFGRDRKPPRAASSGRSSSGIQRLTPEDIRQLPTPPAIEEVSLRSRSAPIAASSLAQAGKVEGWTSGSLYYSVDAHRKSLRTTTSSVGGMTTRVRRHPDEQGPCGYSKKVAKKSTSARSTCSDTPQLIPLRYMGALFVSSQGGQEATRALNHATRRLHTLAMGGRQVKDGEVVMTLPDPGDSRIKPVYLSVPLFATRQRRLKEPRPEPTTRDQVIFLRIQGARMMAHDSLLWTLQRQDNSDDELRHSTDPLRLIHQWGKEVTKQFIELRVARVPHLTAATQVRLGLHSSLLPAKAAAGEGLVPARCGHAAPRYDPHEVCAVCRVLRNQPHHPLGAHLWRGYHCDRCVTSSTWDRYQMAGDELVYMTTLIFEFQTKVDLV